MCKHCNVKYNPWWEPQSSVCAVPGYLTTKKKREEERKVKS